MIDDGDLAALDEDGYLVIPGLLGGDERAAITEVLERLVVEEGDRAGLEVHQEPGTERLSDLVNKTDLLDVTFTHPTLLAAIGHVLDGDFKLSSLNYRAALPGHGWQPLHCDWGEPWQPGQYQVCNSIWLLDDFTEENGATRVVPGSHRTGHPPDGRPTDGRERLLIAPAGTVVVFNSHLWHGGTENRSGHKRRALHSYFTRRSLPQQLDQQAHLRDTTRQRLSAAELFILGVA